MKNPPHVDSLCIKGRGKKLVLSETNALFWVRLWGFGWFCLLSHNGDQDCSDSLFLNSELSVREDEGMCSTPLATFMHTSTSHS